MAARKLVALGLIGPTLDAGTGPRRWERWRPTVALGQFEDLALDRIELLHEKKHAALFEQLAADLRQASPETEVRGFPIAWKDPWDLEEVYAALHGFAASYPFQLDTEDYLVHITTGTHIAQICLFLLTEARYLPGRLVQTSPPRREARAGPGTYAIIDLDLSRYDRLASRFQEERRTGREVLKAGIATRNSAFNRLIERIEEVALASADPMLLTGPTGSGKSHLAGRIYALKKARRRLAGEFVEVNCATLRGDGAMSALFGHVKGAFTGALEARGGLLRRADQGILFLDEVGELGLDEQAMLLRAVEEKTFYPLGSDKPVKSDFQLLAGTNRDLAARVREGRFREDLLARIDLWTFRLPGLAERPEDVEPNLDYELAEVGRREGRRVTMSREARQRFLAFAAGPEGRWPGNFRDFDAALRRMATLARGARIGVEQVEEEIARLQTQWGAPEGAAAGPSSTEDPLPGLLGPAALARLDRFDRVQLAEVVRVCRQGRTLSDAGRVLFAASRQRRSTINDADRLRKYLARFALTGPQVLARS